MRYARNTRPTLPGFASRERSTTTVEDAGNAHQTGVQACGA